MAAKNQKLVDESFVNICNNLRSYDKQLKDNFVKLTTNFDRFKFIWCIGFIHNELDKHFEKEYFDGKDNAKALELRRKGNEMFKAKNFIEALIAYNLCIRYAAIKPKSSVTKETEASPAHNELENELSIAYANRSAVFFHLAKFDLCLNDIDRAFKYEYPAKLKQKLVERKVNCLLHLERHGEIMDFLKSEGNLDLSSLKAFKTKLEEIQQSDLLVEEDKKPESKPKTKKALFNNFGNISFEITEDKKNSRIENASNSLTIDYSFDQGFFLKATKDIEVGEIVVDEPPYASVLLGEYIDENCFECMVPLDILKMNVASCRQCSRVLYCSNECEKLAWKNHHRYECKYLNLLAFESGLTHMEWLALRIVLKAGHDYLKPMKPFLQSYEIKHENFKRDEESMRSIKEINEEYKSNSYMTIFNLITNSGVRSTNDLFRRAYISLFMTKFLLKVDFFKSKDQNLNTNDLKDEACFIGGLILRHLQSISCNAHEISRIKLGENPRKAMETSSSLGIGAGIYSILSIFNHSCDPSVTRYFRGSRCQVRAIKGIGKNDEIFDNYGLIYAVNEVQERQKKLLEQYFFQCSCVACIKDWPTYNNIPSDIHALKLKCPECKINKNDKKDCLDCQAETDNLKLEQMSAFQKLKNLLYFNSSIDITDELVIENLGTIFHTFCKYLKILERKKIPRPFQDYNNYQEAIKQLINFINMR